MRVQHQPWLCALTRNQIGKVLVHGETPSQPSHTVQGWFSLLTRLLLSMIWTFQWMGYNKIEGMSLSRLGYKGKVAAMLDCPPFHSEGSHLPCCDLLYERICMTRNWHSRYSQQGPKAGQQLREWFQKHILPRWAFRRLGPSQQFFLSVNGFML